MLGVTWGRESESVLPEVNGRSGAISEHRFDRQLLADSVEKVDIRILDRGIRECEIFCINKFNALSNDNLRRIAGDHFHIDFFNTIGRTRPVANGSSRPRPSENADFLEAGQKFSHTTARFLALHDRIPHETLAEA
jgi:hypothetical protein